MKFARIIRFFPCLRDLEAAKQQNRVSCTGLICTIKQDHTKTALARAVQAKARK